MLEKRTGEKGEVVKSGMDEERESLEFIFERVTVTTVGKIWLVILDEKSVGKTFV